MGCHSSKAPTPARPMPSTKGRKHQESRAQGTLLANAGGTQATKQGVDMPEHLVVAASPDAEPMQSQNQELAREAVEDTFLKAELQHSAPVTTQEVLAAVPAGSQALAPFQMIVDVLNKEEVMAKKVGNWWGVSAAANYLVSNEMFATKISEKLVAMLPQKLSEAADIELSVIENKSEKEGTRFVLDVQILGFDLNVLCKKGLNLSEQDAARFGKAFDGISEALTKMGMPEKAAAVHSKIANKVRNKIMEKMLEILPQKLAEEGVKINMGIPEYQPSIEAAKAAEALEREELAATKAKLGLGKPFQLFCTIEDRNALVEELPTTKGLAGGYLASNAKKFVAAHISDERLNQVIGTQLQTKVPEALEEKAGIKASCERVSGYEQEGVLVEMSVLAFDTRQLLMMAKGAEFADAFASLFDSLKALSDLGVAGIAERMDGVNSKISAEVCEKVRSKLAEVLAEKLHAKVSDSPPARPVEPMRSDSTQDSMSETRTKPRDRFSRAEKCCC